MTNGNWQLIVNDANQRGGAWDAYLHREGNNPNFYFADDSYDNTRLIGEPGNASNVITVGSYNSKNSWLSDNGQFIDKSFNYPLNEISHFSSPGPTRANFIKPEIYAPGAWITGPVSRYGFDLITENVPFGENLYYTQVGTSFAAPHVTGVVALLLEKWNVQRGQDYGWNYMKELLYEGATPEKYLDAWASLSIDEAPLGIEDKVKIDNNICSGGNKIVIDPGVLNKYCASFYDTNPLGDYMMNYDWSLELFNSDGIFVANTANTGQGPSSTVYLIVDEADLNKNWERDENGNIKGRVKISGVDNDGIYHEDKLNIGLKYKPNKPVIYGHILGSSSITLSFLAGGSENYKVHYSTSPGPPYTGIGANEGNSPLSTSNSEYTISGLDFENNTYYFAVTATNTNGESEYSDPIVIGDDQTFEVFDIVWTDLVKVYANGNTLTRDNSYRGWNAGAASVNILQENLDGWIEMTVQETDEYVMFGLSHSNPGASWNTIKFNVYLHVGTIKVYELGTFKGSFSSYNIGDKIRIERSGSSINYMKNGEIFYSSSTDPNQILLADVCMYTPESTIYNAKASFEAQIIEYDIEWTDLVKVYANGNSLTRDDSYRGWIAGAASSNILSPYQDGWIESTIQETNTYRMFGLSSKNMDASWNTIEYNMYLRNDAKIDIYESGSWKCSNCGTYSTGDKVRLERDGSTINYILNENIIYSSVCDPSQPLLVDVSMYSPGSTIYNTKANFSSSGLNQSMLASYNVFSDNYDLDPISIDSLLIPAGADNNFEESDIINVSQKTYSYDANTADSLNTLSNIKINPNPTKGALNLKYLSPNEKDIHISIIDVDNFIVYFEKDWIIKKGENKMKIDISLLKPDIYIIRFFDGKNTYSRRIKKE